MHTNVTEKVTSSNDLQNCLLLLEEIKQDFFDKKHKNLCSDKLGQ